MSDENHPDVVCAKATGVRWRVFELESCQKYFGLSMDGRPEDMNVAAIHRCGAKTVVWKLHTEATDETLWKHCCSVASQLSMKGIKHINNPCNWLACHSKEEAFRIWRQLGIPCPQWFEFRDVGDFLAKRSIEYPLLLRLNNSTSGWFSYLVHNDQEARNCWPKLQAAFSYCHDGSTNTGTRRKFIAVQFIPTTRPEKVNLSFRIIVAGNIVVTGYARLGPAADWIAITNRFEPGMEELFIHYQKVCQRFCEDNAALIVKAVKVLGLNFQGVDVILDQQDHPYFLEVQPGFSVGYAEVKSWKPPFYNPSQPEALVRFLRDNLGRLQREIPMYANSWLDKHTMFDRSYQALKESLYGFAAVYQ